MASATSNPFEWAPAAATVLSGALSLIGGSDSAEGNRQAGDSARAAGERAAAAAEDAGRRQAESEIIKGTRAKQAKTFEAQQLEQQAGQQAAAAQRTATEERRQAKLVQSRAIAVAAASGAGASDPSIVNLVSRIAGEGTYRANVALFQGDERARMLRMQAAGKNYEGLTAEEAGGLNAADALAKWKATAVSERAKGEAAQQASEIAAKTALNKGVGGAASTLLPLGASLLEKYGGKFMPSGAPGIIKGGSARDSGVDMTLDEADAASEAWGEDLAKVSESEYADRVAADEWVKYQTDLDAAYALENAEAYAAWEATGGMDAADFEWLMLL